MYLAVIIKLKQTEMKLQFKHILPYLDDNLKIQWTQTKEIMGINFNDSTDYSENTYPLSTIIFTLNSDEELGWKPILTPMNNIIEIMPNSKVTYIDYLWNIIIATDSDAFNKEDFYENCELGLIEHLPIMCYNQLIKWKFDIFSLVPRNLAIDSTALPC